MSKPTLKDLLLLAKKIKNKELREKTTEALKRPSLSNKTFAYPPDEISEAFAGPTHYHHGYKGGLVEHTYNVTVLALDIAKHLKRYKKIDLDVLIAGSLLHDLGKLFEFQRVGDELQHSGMSLEHDRLWGAELYARGFPEEVVHIVLSHRGKEGASEPKTIEALIVHHADTLDAEAAAVEEPLIFLSFEE